MRVRTIISIVVAIAALGFAAWLVLRNDKTTLLNEFVIVDTTTVTKMFLSDKNNNSVVITKDKDGKWILNNGKPAIAENVSLILKTMQSIEIKYPVSEAAYNTAVQRLATQSTKVEIYQTTPAIEIFGIKLFTSEKLAKVFYVGGPTQDNLGTLMKSGDNDKIYITYIPGLNGYLTERFSPKIADWQDHTICEYLVSEIKEIKIELVESTSESYRVLNNDNRTFKIIRLVDGSEVADYDTVKILRLVSSFNKVSFEALLDKISKNGVDSIRKTFPFAVVTVYPKVGKEVTIKMHRRPNKDKLLDVNGMPFAYDMDRCYAFVTGVEHPVVMQYFITDNFTKKLSQIIDKAAEVNKFEMLELGN